ncbi:DNA polymerase III subunit chi [Hyphobacterium sp. HN65]|uniref:DNA polymerase III subunit chi n=1 Tax=Hyphobacterium lacteum TaxID=3116575 RepID=A0ABU7LLH2_9PROT|nr:DNA polymerase III subunit chi [Hyphobacterium sp. HN65]MEE2524782.1 DNA polymerase III subunit chi [Hyphobacterium sp. HN65]
MPGELWFYHLERTTLADALPELLEKTLEKGWRALVRTSSTDRLKELDQRLWTVKEDNFLAHGRSDEPDPDRQPILLSLEEDNANKAQVLFTLDGVEPENPDGFERCCVMFDAADEAAINASRALWKKAKGEGRSVAYWQQSVEGRWEKKA